MFPILFGSIAGVLSLLSTIPYTIRILRREINPPLTSWLLWTGCGIILLFTYWDAVGVRNWYSTVPMIVGAISPGVIALILLLRRDPWTRPNIWNILCFICGLFALCLWMRSRNDAAHAHEALWWSIAADACGFVPSFFLYVKEPWEDRPLPWILFAVAYIFSLLAITTRDWQDYILGIYALFAGTTLSIPLVRYRIEVRATLKEWF